jgi:hypothetical protein
MFIQSQTIPHLRTHGRSDVGGPCRHRNVHDGSIVALLYAEEMAEGVFSAQAQ